MGAVEALYIYDEHNNVIVDHYYYGRPPSANTLIQLYLKETVPRPALLYLPTTSPPTLLFSHLHDRLLFLCPSSSEREPLLVSELLRRVTDALEEFLGVPLLPSKIEANYDVVLQIIGEVCDAGVIHNTEPNALREVVEVDDWVGNILGGIGLPAASPALNRSQSPAFGNTGQGAGALSSTSAAGSAVPWRRSNVKHTSNELYVDIVETLAVLLAPSGRPMSAFANGTIAFNAKISGVPDLILSLAAPGGKQSIGRAMDTPVFHPCVRLNRWRERPGELSFVPPDGRFALAGYQCDLLPDIFTDSPQDGKIPVPNVLLPISVTMQSCLGIAGNELELRLSLPLRISAGASAAIPLHNSAATKSLGNAGRIGINGTSSPNATGGPTPENIVVSVPVPSAVRNITDIRVSKGEAHFLPSEAELEWRVSAREASTIGSAGATLRCTILGMADLASHNSSTEGMKLKTDTFDYDEGMNDSNHDDLQRVAKSAGQPNGAADIDVDFKIKNQNAVLMPQSACLSFNVKGWLPSGIRVEALAVNTKSSRGLGAGVSPYKGVKYHTISSKGIEIRC